MRRILLVSTLVLCMAAELSAAVWGSRGITRRFLANGDRLYAADGRGVSLYDVADPAAPRRLDVESGDAESSDLALLGESDLLLATADGVDRFAVAGDGTLTRAGSLPIPGGAERVAAGEVLAAASTGQVVRILAIEDDRLVERRSIAFERRVVALAFVSGWLYAAVEGEGFDVVDPSSAAVVTTVAHLADGFSLSGATLWTASPVRGLARFDVADPAAPVMTWETREVRPHDVAASAERVTVITPPDSVAVFSASGSPNLVGMFSEPASVVAASGTNLFLAGAPLDAHGLPVESGLALRSFDLTDPARPRSLGEFQDLAGPVSGVWTDGSIAYVVDRPWLRVLDVSRTEAPRQVAAIEIPGIQERIRVKDGIAVIYGRTFVNIVDVSRPAAPRYLGSWYTQGVPHSTAALASGKLIEANGGSGLHVVDFTDPGNAVQVGGRIWHYYSLAAGDDVVYAMQYQNFLVLELADGRTIVDRASIPMEGKQLEIAPPAARIPRYLVGLEHRGIRVWDLADRFDPVELGFVETADAEIVGTGDAVAWVAQRGELYRLDLANPAALVPGGIRVTAPMQISVAGEKIVVADRYFVRVYGPDTASPRPSRRRGARH